MPSIRPRVLALSLFAALLATNVPSAFANFRTGTISWERVPAADTATTYRVDVSVELAFRWSYPFGGPASNCGSFPTLPAVTQTTGPGACPAVGTQLDFGTLNFSGGPAPAALVATVTAIHITADTFYATATIPITFLKTANPITVSYESNSRSSSLLEGNGDQPFRLEAVIDVTKGTKSPRSTAVPFIPVVTGVSNDVLLSSVAFDGLQNRWDFSTPQQSQLVSAIPLGMTLDQGQPGLVHFTPQQDGAYGVQFRVTSHDTQGGAKNSVPLDMLFVAGPAPANAVSITAPTELVAGINSLLQFTVGTTLSNPLGYTAAINHTPLPAGASMSATPCVAGLSVCLTTFSWTPTANSTSGLVCFQGANSNLASTLTSPQLCVRITMPAQPTTMQVFPVSAAAGGPASFIGSLTRTSDGAPLIDRDVTFRYQDTGELIGTARTDAGGTATLTTIVMQPKIGAFTATFDAVANEFLQSSASASVVVTKEAAGILTNLSPVGNPSLGLPLEVSVRLARSHPDGETNPGPQTVNFQVTAAAIGYQLTGAVQTDANGLAAFTFTPALVSATTYTVNVTFAGSTNLFPASAVQTSFTPRQRIQLTVNAPAQATAGVSTPVTATLIKIPQNTPIVSRIITASSSLAATGVLAGVTDASGVRTLSTLNFTAVGSATLTFAASLAAGESDSDGVVTSEQATAQITVSKQATQLTISPATAAVGQHKSLTAVLKKTPSGQAMANTLLTFSIVGGATLGTATTSASGSASLAFTPTDVFDGSYQVDYNGTALIEASTAQATLTVTKGLTSIDPYFVYPAFVGDSISATVEFRSGSPSGPLTNAPVTFTLTGDAGNPGGATTATVQMTTDAFGDATVTFPATARGLYTLTASYDGSALLNGSSRSAPVEVYQKTRLVMSDPNGYASDSLNVSASLLAVPGDTPISGQLVDFSFLGVVPNGTATTINGVASLARTFGAAGSYPVTASFSNPADYFRDENGNAVPAVTSATVTAGGVITSLASLSVAPTALVGSTLSVSTVLTRVSVPAGTLGGREVIFVLTPPVGSPVSTSVNTDAAGMAAVAFPALTASGSYTLSASFVGNIALTGAFVSTTIGVYERTQLTAQSVTGVVNAATSVTATLISLPSGAPLSGQTVAFSFGGEISDTTAVTNAAGVATAPVVFPSSGTFAVTASFAGAASFYADHTGAFPIIPETSSAAVTVSGAQTALSAITAPSQALVGGSMVVSTTLTRTSTPIGPVGGAIVNFTVISPGGTTSMQPGTTGPDGVATVTVNSLTERGPHRVIAQFAATSSLSSATAAAAVVTVYQRTSLVVSPVVGATAGSSTAVSATLVALPSNTPIAGKPVTFSTSEAGIGPVTLFTAVNGVAATAFVFPAASTVSIAASFVDVGDYFANHLGELAAEVDASSAAGVSVGAAVAALSPLSLPTTGLVGSPLSVSTSLSAFGGIGIPGHTVSFLVTQPDGTPLNLEVLTQSDGSASVSFLATQRGVYNFVAQFAGGIGLAAVSTDAASVTVYQRVSLSLTAPNGVAGAGVPVTAALTTVPGGAGVAGQTVNVTLSNQFGLAYQQSLLTDANGIAEATVTLASAGAFTGSASFQNLPGYFVDANGAQLPTATTTAVSIAKATTSLASLTSVSSSLVDEELTVSTVLMRTSAPAGGAMGETVYFTVTDPSGSTALSGSAVTGAGGAVSFRFTPTRRGLHSISAAFQAGSSLEASTTSAITVPVYQRTRIEVLPVLNASAGSQTSVSATLVAIPSNTPIAGKPVTFSTSKAGVGPATVSTGVNGVAATSFVFPSAETVSITGSFVDIGDYFANHLGQLVAEIDASSAASVTVGTAVATLSPLSVPTASLIGSPLSVSTSLTAFGGIGIPGHTISFLVTQPDGTPLNLQALTQSDGSAFVDFLATQRGVYSFVAQFAGDSALAAVSTAAANATVYQRTNLTLTAPPTAVAGNSVQFTATLTTAPGGAGVAGQLFEFRVSSQTGGGLTHQGWATTDANGVASVTLGFAVADSYIARVEFPSTDYYLDAAGALPPVSSIAVAVVTVAKASTSLATLTAPSGSMMDSLVTVSTVLTRTDAPAGPANGETVFFTVTDPNGLTSLSGSAVTTAAGVVSYEFLPTTRGLHTVTASFAAGAGLSASTSNTMTIGVFQRTAIAVQPASGNVGTPVLVSATLTKVPGDGPLAGKSVGFQFFGQGAPAAVLFATTDVNGVASVTATFTQVGSYAVHAHFVDTANFYTNFAGSVPPTMNLAISVVTITNTAPTIVDLPDLSGEATGPTGRAFSFTSTGSDAEEAVTPVCTAASGMFPIGTTTVTCTVTDSAGLSASDSFTITVTVTPAAVGTLLTQFFDSPSEAAKANQTLNLATRAPNANARAAHLNKLLKDIEKQVGKTLTSTEAATLSALIQRLY